MESWQILAFFKGVSEELDVLDSDFHIGGELLAQTNKQRVSWFELAQDPIIADCLVQFLVSLPLDSSASNDQVCVRDRRNHLALAFQACSWGFKVALLAFGILWLSNVVFVSF